MPSFFFNDLRSRDGSKVRLIQANGVKVIMVILKVMKDTAMQLNQ